MATAGMAGGGGKFDLCLSSVRVLTMCFCLMIYVSVFSFFLYKSQTIRVSSEVIKEIKSNIKLYDKEINITELTFLEIFLSKFKKINKIEFLFKFYINNFKYLK